MSLLSKIPCTLSGSSFRVQYCFSIEILDFPDGSVGKESTCNVGDSGDAGSIPGSGRSPGEGNGNPLQCCCLEKSHGQRSLVGHSL